MWGMSKTDFQSSYFSTKGNWCFLSKCWLHLKWTTADTALCFILHSHLLYKHHVHLKQKQSKKLNGMVTWDALALCNLLHKVATKHFFEKMHICENITPILLLYEFNYMFDQYIWLMFDYMFDLFWCFFHEMHLFAKYLMHTVLCWYVIQLRIT